MFIHRKVLVAAALLSASSVAGQASANTSVVVPGGPLDTANPIADLPYIALNTARTYDFTFSFDSPLAHDQWWIEAFAQTNDYQNLQPIEIDLYSGVPAGMHSFISTSPFSNVATVRFVPMVGDYYAEIKPTYIATNNETVSGYVFLAVPEPAPWFMLLVGFGALGLALRRRAAQDRGAALRPMASEGSPR